MQSTNSDDSLDSVLQQLDYTFIDLPDLIDDDEEPAPEPVYTQSVYAFDASRAQTAHEQQQQQQQAPSSAVSGSYWQQLQQFNEAKQAVVQVLGVTPGILGSSLAQAAQQQYQQPGQQQQVQQQQLSVQQPPWGWRQPYEPATPPAGRSTAGPAGAAGSSSSEAGSMDEG